jgi:hypothetical protein
VTLSKVAGQHAEEAGYTHWLEVRLAGWQAWYEKLVKDYGPVAGPQQ